jgi:hypothetical protein
MRIREWRAWQLGAVCCSRLTRPPVALSMRLPLKSQSPLPKSPLCSLPRLLRNQQKPAAHAEHAAMLQAHAPTTAHAWAGSSQPAPARRLRLQVLERGREVSKRDWQLLRVAIVELRGAVFIGRRVILT